MATLHPDVRSQTRDTRSVILETGREIMARRGFSAVGLTEILMTAGVPKGSFYHYFGSKDAFGEAMIQDYFEGYAAEVEELCVHPGLNMAERLMVYFANWRGDQEAFAFQGRCLAVKLGAEVSDLSEAMRLALKVGTNRIIALLEKAVAQGVNEGSIRIVGTPRDTAASLYHLWLGASIMAKILRSREPFETVLQSTRRMLGIAQQ